MSDDILRQLQELDRQKGEVLRELGIMERKYGFDYGENDRVREEMDRYDELYAANERLQETMQDLIDEFDIDDRQFENF